MTAKQKIVNVEAQIRAVLRASTNILNCPWCGAQNKEPASAEQALPLCCADMALAVNAISDKLQSDELLDAADHISQNAAKQASKN